MFKTTPSALHLWVFRSEIEDCNRCTILYFRTVEKDGSFTKGTGWRGKK